MATSVLLHQSCSVQLHVYLYVAKALLALPTHRPKWHRPQAALRWAAQQSRRARCHGGANSAGAPAGAAQNLGQNRPGVPGSNQSVPKSTQNPESRGTVKHSRPKECLRHLLQFRHEPNRSRPNRGSLERRTDTASWRWCDKILQSTACWIANRILSLSPIAQRINQRPREFD